MAFDPQTQLANVAVVVDETARLKEVFRAWPESYGQRPTYCPDWRAGDTVAHLATEVISMRTWLPWIAKVALEGKRFGGIYGCTSCGCQQTP